MSWGNNIYYSRANYVAGTVSHLNGFGGSTTPTIMYRGNQIFSPSNTYTPMQSSPICYNNTATPYFRYRGTNLLHKTTVYRGSSCGERLCVEGAWQLYSTLRNCYCSKYWNQAGGNIWEWEDYYGNLNLQLRDLASSCLNNYRNSFTIQMRIDAPHSISAATWRTVNALATIYRVNTDLYLNSDGEDIDLGGYTIRNQDLINHLSSCFNFEITSSGSYYGYFINLSFNCDNNGRIGIEHSARCGAIGSLWFSGTNYTDAQLQNTCTDLCNYAASLYNHVITRDGFNDRIYSTLPGWSYDTLKLTYQLRFQYRNDEAGDRSFYYRTRMRGNNNYKNPSNSLTEYNVCIGNQFRNPYDEYAPRMPTVEPAQFSKVLTGTEFAKLNYGYIKRVGTASWSACGLYLDSYQGSMDIWGGYYDWDYYAKENYNVPNFFLDSACQNLGNTYVWIEWTDGKVKYGIVPTSWTKEEDTFYPNY